ncbi:hypothetical protein AZI11_06720 [Levilactobacillus brevis]|uniref:hypothetical protein n=1 Tax=Levilactobacillus brevis TaxID=1580 RepID=UPI000A2016DB|nr:hypothetical protein [Levilactobacillus brevis]ARN92609.1 hypothetical protein AZI11_06720 [Levilactobacillus brevis]ARN95274.1 hypothetical protein AZI12_06765 [Levilactobacillus brevis]
MKKSLLMMGAMMAALGTSELVAQVNPQPVSAHTTKKAKWHSGTPKALRGKYRTKHYGADLMMVYKIRPKSTWFWGSGMPVITGKNVAYKSLGHHRYLIRENEPANGSFRGAKNAKVSVTKVGHNLKVRGYKLTFYKY